MKTKHIQLYHENKLIKEAKKKKRGEKRRRKETENQNSKETIQIDYSKVVHPKSMLKLGIFAC